MEKEKKYSVLFVCMGNICRSPAAEGVFAKLCVQKGLDKYFFIDSAGTYGGHEGELPDLRMRQVAARRGIELKSRSRKIRSDDFLMFDKILYMDDANLQVLNDIAPNTICLSKLENLTNYCTKMEVDHVPDPYYGGSNGFDYVMDLLEDACLNLLRTLEDRKK